ncbi:MAG: PucR family transcriptional regulator [Lachnospiraceae bacterium]
MALTLRELIDLTKKQYHLKVLAGKDNLEHVVTWVHMMEDTTITEFFWGNELVVVGGYSLKTDEDIFRLIDKLDESRCVGIVINIGKYVQKVPKSVCDYCEERTLPLLTMPWDMYITEFVRECCSLINQSSRKEELIAQTVLNVVFSPQEIEASREKLDEFFEEEQGFQMIAIRAKQSGAFKSVADWRSVLRLHTALRHYNFFYLIFRYEKRFMILMNEKKQDVAEEIVTQIIRTIKEAFPEISVCVGMSEAVDSYENLADCFHGAISASRCAALQNMEIVRFKDMGFYKLLYSVPDDTLLLRYYHEMMDPLLKYDIAKNSMYTETLFRYLLSDGSLQEVASKMYTHRNTVNYRMGKIRELLGCELSSQKERLPYLIAYHIGVILRLNKDFE